MAQQVKADIVIGGKKLEHFTHLQINQSLFTHHTFEIAVPFEVLEDKNDFFFKQSHTAMVGEVATISFKPLYKNVSADFKFSGIVTELTIVNNTDMINSFLIKGHSPTYLMEDGHQRRAWVETPLPMIMNAVLKDYPGSSLPRNVDLTYTSLIDYKAQYDESNWEFVTRLCREYSQWCYYDGTKLILGRPENQTVPFLIDGIQHFNMSVSLKPNQFQMYHYNYQKDEDYRSNGKPVNGIGVFGNFAYAKSASLFSRTSLRWPLRDVQTKSELDEAVEATNISNATDLITFEGAGENPNLTIGIIVDVTTQKLTAPGKYKQESVGKYRIIGMIHFVDEVGNYGNRFEAVPFSAEMPPRNSLVRTPTALPEIATVIKNDDPKKLGRVKVKFHWPNALEAKSSWVRVAMAYTGGARGSLFIPEVNDQVLISYEANHVDFPVIAGSLYHKDPATNYFFDNNYQKIIRTKGGNKIVMKDKPGEQEFFITNANNKDTGLHISFKDDGVIQIYTKGLIQMEAKNITMHTTENITMHAEGNVKITADKEMALHGQKKVDVTGTEFNVKADSKVDITGPNVDVYE
ncbi:type VI secretion system Vgr family protein [Fibrella forsythiae]|uniref:Rhs element Vgr protein n=1 Tax=Fibrella forsythiae TaxID=2817061 RepID=A0ABS3JLC0_9BACT|nr:phage baseplate assembly protein V [Fibrella forsythiae]MBO0950795.1 rhs element Vgr protein [Fibrella forsythiae]